MKKMTDTVLDQKGSVTMEFMGALIFLLVLILFMVDLFGRISIKGKLERTSYSLLNIVKERHVVEELTKAYTVSSRNKQFGDNLQKIANLLVYGELVKNNKKTKLAGVSYLVEVVNYKKDIKGELGKIQPHIAGRTPNFLTSGYIAISREDKYGHECVPKVLLNQAGSPLLSEGEWKTGGRRQESNVLANNLTALDVDDQFTSVYRVTVCIDYRSLFAKIYDLLYIGSSECNAGGNNSSDHHGGVVCASSVGIGR